MFRLISATVDRYVEALLNSISARVARMSDLKQFIFIMGSMVLASLAFSYFHPTTPILRWCYAIIFSSVLLFLTIPFMAGIFLQKWAIYATMKPNLAEIRQLRWESFEYFVQLVLQDLGYTVIRHGGKQADGGIDLIAHKDGKKYVIQCKHYQGERIGVKIIRELIGVAYLQQADGCILITSGYIHDYARREFEACPFVQLWDGDRIVSLLQANHASDKNEKEDEPEGKSAPDRGPLSIISHLCSQASRAEGYFRIPDCPKCGRKMHLIKLAESTFWGCYDYRKCGCRGLPLSSHEKEYL